ncbi:hypothetical protein F2Q70_00013016 [Brassica cretica]|uniref:Uncharacterized protein n=1 Tax=Brassica cretica TaxID=69181 RepID=A0A8S9LT99_BRACR|nr:hypothetical protein F2Q70_00013016 [Brassica cretica]
MGATLPERRHELDVPYLSERPYQSDNTRSLAIFVSERPPRATRRSRSSSRVTSPQRHPEVARVCVENEPGATSRSDVPRSLRFNYLVLEYHMEFLETFGCIWSSKEVIKVIIGRAVHGSDTTGATP